MARARTARRTKTRKAEIEALDPAARFRESVRHGDDWFDALLEAVASWEAIEEVVDDRSYRYLIGGEAFDWLLLAERLLDEVDGAVSQDEREALLFFGLPPRPLDDADFRRAIGDAKHRAHLNFVYGVAVEEALQLTVEEEVLKERRSSIWNCHENVDQQVFQRIYNKSLGELLAAYREERALPQSEDIALGELRAFTYWLFKYRVNDSDPARVASDTRKALAQISALEAASRRRADALAEPDASTIVDGEVVARFR